MIDSLLFIIAVAGGVVSFLSPCNAVTLPVFVSFLQVQAKTTKRAILLSLAFSLGFILMFTIIASLYILISGFITYMFWLKIFSGIIIISMAIYLFFYKVSKRANPNDVDQTQDNDYYRVKYEGYTGAILLGFSMGAPWIACITPVYITIVAIASIQETFILGMLLFSLYGLGLMLPYILIGAALGKINQRFIVKLIKLGATLQKVFSIVLIWIGIELVLSAFGIGGLLPFV